MEASLFSIQLLYTSHIEKADSLSTWRPLPFLCAFYMQLIYRRLTKTKKHKDIQQKPKPRHRKNKKTQGHSAKTKAKTQKNQKNTRTLSKNQSQDTEKPKKTRDIQSRKCTGKGEDSILTDSLP